jgi:hypothetical protein
MYKALRVKSLMVKTKKLLAVVIAIFTVALQSAIATNTLSLTVATNKKQYSPGDVVYVSGSLTWVPNMIPVTDGLVGVEITNPTGLPFIYRTRPTGNATTQNWVANFTQFYPCDAIGNPTYSFQTGEDIFVHVEIRNFDQFSTHFVRPSVVLYDAKSVPIIASSPSGYALEPNSSMAVFFKLITIPSSTNPGNATLYGSVFSDYPMNGGYPYCPEQTTTVTITTGTSGSPLEPSSDGTYNLSFKFPTSGTRVGNYTVYVNTYYYNTLVTSNATFTLRLIGDINSDGVVNILDAISLSNAFDSRPGDPKWYSAADITGDGVVNILDAITLANNFGLGG